MSVEKSIYIIGPLLTVISVSTLFHLKQLFDQQMTIFSVEKGMISIT